MRKSFKLLFFSGAINDKQIVIVPEGNIQFSKDVRSIYRLHKRKSFDDLKNYLRIPLICQRHVMQNVSNVWLQELDGTVFVEIIISFHRNISTFHLFCNKRSKAVLFYYVC